MLRHIGLAAVVFALVALTADTVHARGGMRGRSNFSYGFGNSGYFPGYFSPTAGSQVSSHARGSSTARSSNASGNTSSGQVTIQTPTISLTTKTISATGATTAATRQSTTPSTNANTTPSQSVTQPTVTTSPFALTPAYTIPLDPNTAAQSQYGALLHNAKQLIKAGMYVPAATYLQRIINGAPGTRIAVEAQRLLSRLPVS